MSGAERTPAWMDAHAPGPHDEGDGGEISPLSIAIVLLRGRRVIAALALLCAVPVGILGLLRHRSYTSQSMFLAQARRQQAGLSGIAAQFGISVPTGDAAQSPDFYADLVKTHHILKAAVDTPYVVRTPEGEKRGTLVELLEAEGKTPDAREEDAIERLRDGVSTSVNTKTGVIQVSVATPYAALSQAVNARLFALLNAYNLVGRQSQARAERVFAEGRLTEVRQSLTQAEEALQGFRQHNRVYSDVSDLNVVQQRLEREVTRQQQLYTTLLQMYEQSRLEEVRDTPVFSVIEPPEIPRRPDPRGVIKRTGVALAVGVFLGAFVAFAREAVRRYRREDADDSDTLSRLWNETRTDARRLATLRFWSRPANKEGGVWPS